MTDNITNNIDSALQLVSDFVQPSVTDAASDVKTGVPQESDVATASLEQAAAALVQYVQTVMVSSDSTPASDNTAVLKEMATTFMQQTATAISENVTTLMASESGTSDSTASTNLTQASSTFVQHLGDILMNPQASDTVPTAVLMQDVQKIWENKKPTDTLASTASTIWDSVKSSQHLPVIAGMLASVIFRKK